MRSLHFWVPGKPIPKGSKVPGVTKDGRPYLREQTGSKAWEKVVRDYAWKAFDEPAPLDCPVRVRAIFHLPRPKKSKFGDYPAGNPDADKLFRAIGDAMKGIVYTDDGRIISEAPGKKWAEDGRVGVWIEVEWAEPGERLLLF